MPNTRHPRSRRSASLREADATELHNEAVAALGRWLKLPDSAVEDSVQHAWCRYLERGDHVHREGLPGWLLIVARNHYFADYNKHIREPALAEIPERQTDDDWAEIIDFNDAVARLRPVRRTGALIRLLGLSYAQGVEATGQTLTWVNRQVTEARVELREELAA